MPSRNPPGAANSSSAARFADADVVTPGTANSNSAVRFVDQEADAPGAGWRTSFQRHQDTFLGILAMALFFIAWELLPHLGLIKPAFTSSPSRIAAAAQWLFANGLWYDIWISLQEFVLGFGLAIAIGIPLGLALGWFPRLRAMVEPFVVVLDAVPRVALLPLVIIWLGIGLESKVMMVFLGAVFPIVISVMTGVRTIDVTLVRCARAFGASDGQLMRTVVVPSSVPFMVSGMRLGAGRGLVGIVVGELLASSAGIGHMMDVAGATFQTDKVFVGVLLLALFGLLLTQTLKALETRVDRWRPHA